MAALEAFPNLQAKKVKASWADQMDEIHGMEELCRRDSITLEEFARLIHHILPKCELDTTKTAHHFQIDDTFVDLMYRDHVVISVSKQHRRIKDDSSTSSSDDDLTLSEDEETDEKSKDPVEAIPTVIPSEAVSTDDGWQEVVTKKTKHRRAAQKFLEKEGAKTFYFFSNEANANFMDFVGVVTGLDQLVESAKNEKWSHGYCVEENVVYDLNNPDKPGDFRFFIPNTAYLHKFSQWFEVYQQNNDTVPPDQRDFYVFKENSTWPKWTFVSFITGLPMVRRLVQTSGAEFGHAYCLDTNDLVNFQVKDGHFHQQQSKAPGKYISRFQEFLDKHDLEAKK